MPTVFYVDPRYTPGTAGLVPERLAVEVAAAELNTFHALKEFPEFDPESARRAEFEGLARVVYSIRDDGGYIIFTDLITGEALRAPREMADSMWALREKLVQDR